LVPDVAVNVTEPPESTVQVEGLPLTHTGLPVPVALTLPIPLGDEPVTTGLNVAVHTVVPVTMALPPAQLVDQLPKAQPAFGVALTLID